MTIKIKLRENINAMLRLLIYDKDCNDRHYNECILHTTLNNMFMKYCISGAMIICDIEFASIFFFDFM